MEAKFDLYHWDNVKGKLKSLYPQLTDADLFWRHETMDSLYNSIATKTGNIEENIFGSC